MAAVILSGCGQRCCRSNGVAEDVADPVSASQEDDAAPPEPHDPWADLSPVLKIAPRVSQRYSDAHQAVDLAVPVGTPIYAPKDGSVQYVGVANGWCDMKDMYTNDLFVIMVDADARTTWSFGHLSAAHVDELDQVRAGDKLGESGGHRPDECSRGPHVHFRVKEVVQGRLRPVDPEQLEGLWKRGRPELDRR